MRYSYGPSRREARRLDNFRARGMTLELIFSKGTFSLLRLEILRTRPERPHSLNARAALVGGDFVMNVYQRIGLTEDGRSAIEEKPIRYVNLKLAALGCPTVESDDQGE